ncbi:hypothetical protein [Tunicatimonas pelagia]|uniref:hypothetical protein n=1 Tax=Tunicatimonas pelagia TaxID=931531 RepID=UPI002665A5C2|nr:hypothetical protein [Tunicatimonas pelagia]WKN44923.1 hypothetical protein P0M28_08100 [Tunicatimonas pelagia]
MKHLVISSVLSLTLFHLGQAQRAVSQDTVYVSDQAKSYLLFDHPVSLVDVGNPAWYEAQIEGNAVLVVARADSVPATPIYAVVNNEPFTGVLSFQPQPNSFYDFREVKTPASQAITGVNPRVLQERLRSMQTHLDLRYGQQQEGGITFRLVGVMHDLSATYLKFKVENQSSVVYRTDFIGFQRRQRYRKGFFAKEKEVTFPIEPLVAQNIHPVLPYSEGYYYYALPLWAYGAKESLLATLREESGSRTLTLKISPRLIRRADLF